MTENLAALRELLETEAPTSLSDATDKFRAYFPGLKKERFNTFTNSYYANLDDVINQIRPFMQVLDLRFDESIAWIDDRQMLFVSLQWHDEKITSDVNLTYQFDRVPDGGPQKFLGLVTYMRRMCRTAMLGLSEPDDDSGGWQELEKRYAPMTDEQKNKIHEYLRYLDITTERALDRLKKMKINVNSIDELTYNDAAAVINLLKTRYAEKKKDARSAKS